MQKHEYFEELCALAVAGQLPVDEHKELYSHMRVWIVAVPLREIL